MNKDQVKGRVKEAAGKVKEETGKAVGNKTMQGEGLAQKIGGKVQGAAGDARDNARKTK